MFHSLRCENHNRDFLKNNKNSIFFFKKFNNMFVLGMERFNRGIKNDLKNVLKNREERFRFFGDSFQYKYQVKNRHG
jgi:hypothetical protein